MVCFLRFTFYALRSMPMSQKTRWLLVAITLLAFWLRLPGLFANSFQGDEALFATWARLIAVWREPLLQTQLVDKPPLLFYLQALFYPLQGPVEWAARLPNWIASILLVPLTAQWVWRWYGNDDGRPTADGRHFPRALWIKPAVVAAMLVTLSPFAIQFSPTAFLDPLLLFWLVGSMALIDRPGWSGILFGLALLTKHQAWLFLPLLLAVGSWRWAGLAFTRWLAGMLPLLAILFLWEWLRAGSLTLWQAQVSNFGGTRLIWSWELWPRLLAWVELGNMVWAGGWLGVVFLLLTGGGMAWLWVYGRLPDRLLILFSLAYLAVHWLLAIPVWDRYLLLLVPILALLLARCLNGTLFSFRGKMGRIVLPVLVVLLLLPGAWSGRNGRLPIGGQTDADQGIATAAIYLEDAPYGTVLYDHWHSWQWRYHLFDKRVHLSWIPHPAQLTEDLLVFGGDGHARYLSLPNTPAALPFSRAVAEAGLCLEPAYQAEGLALYLIVTCTP
jgi:4-amino-4-deoxy-L-arabinose transferase-like glycosyltransferase